MANNHYRILYRMGDVGDGEFRDVIVVDGDDVVIEVDLPREADYDEMRLLSASITNDKPRSLVRSIVAGWLRQLELRPAAARSGRRPQSSKDL